LRHFVDKKSGALREGNFVGKKTFISGPQPQKAVETNHARGEQALKRKNSGREGGEFCWENIL
jgi:hypothetical protein